MEAALENINAENIKAPAERNALRFRLSSGVCSVPLLRVHHIAAFATLSGESDEYFLGWLRFHGEWVPVFDLNRMVCEEPTPETLGTRIIIAIAGENAPTALVGLLAADVTDTVPSGATGVEAISLDMYLPMLYTLMPPLPSEPAA